MITTQELNKYLDKNYPLNTDTFDFRVFMKYILGDPNSYLYDKNLGLAIIYNRYTSHLTKEQEQHPAVRVLKLNYMFNLERAFRLAKEYLCVEIEKDLYSDKGEKKMITKEDYLEFKKVHDFNIYEREILIDVYNLSCPSCVRSFEHFRYIIERIQSNLQQVSGENIKKFPIFGLLLGANWNYPERVINLAYEELEREISSWRYVKAIQENAKESLRIYNKVVEAYQGSNINKYPNTYIFSSDTDQFKKKIKLTIHFKNGDIITMTCNQTEAIKMVNSYTNKKDFLLECRYTEVQDITLE